MEESRKIMKKHLYPTSFHFRCVKDIIFANGTIPVIAYTGSNCCYNTNKKVKCEDVNFAKLPSTDGDKTSFNHSLIKGIRKGNLLYPNADIMHIRLISYIVIQKIASLEKFLRLTSQHALSVNSF